VDGHRERSQDTARTAHGTTHFFLARLVGTYNGLTGGYVVEPCHVDLVTRDSGRVVETQEELVGAADEASICEDVAVGQHGTNGVER
jgi:membrane carboxypeptidase/penicillin-binding protein